MMLQQRRSSLRASRGRFIVWALLFAGCGDDARSTDNQDVATETLAPDSAPTDVAVETEADTEATDIAVEIEADTEVTDVAAETTPDVPDPCLPVEICNGVDDDCDDLVDEDFDLDGDGWTTCQGDCCDVVADGCSEPALIGPFAAEVLGNGIDDDCDDVIDPPPPPCDEGDIALDTNDPRAAIRAVGLCHEATSSTDWGVIAARWTLPDGAPPPVLDAFDLGHGVLPSFGPNVWPQEGRYLLALSSGTARQPFDPGYQSPAGFDKLYTSGHPAGFPKEAAACPGVITGQAYDGIALEVTLRVPDNAYGFAFDHKFYSYEWPDFICDVYNDHFIVNVSPIPQGLVDGNVAYDAAGNPVSVNNANLDVCTCWEGPPCTAGGKSFTCEGGNAELRGTGFGVDHGPQDHAATSWLSTTVPAVPGSTIVVTITVYDSGDGVLDATALVDNWTWIASPGVLPTTVKKVDPVQPPTCTIDGVEQPYGTLDPSDECRACRPEVSSTAWSTRPVGAPCATGACVDGLCQGCVIDGVPYAPAYQVPGADCVGCWPEISEDAWTSSPDGAPCYEGLAVCGAGTCQTTCDIDDAVRALAERHPDDQCQACIPALSLDAWSVVPDGWACHDGYSYCTAGVCETGGCTIDGVAYPIGPSPTDDCTACAPIVRNDAWSPREDFSFCADGGGLCLGGDCVACTIDGVKHPAYYPNPANECEVCEPALTLDAWTPRPDLEPCSMGLCVGGVCTP